jgi:GYF domain 2
MNYYVARGGETYGPYSLETVQKYLAEGSILATDMARQDGSQDWVPLRNLLNLPATTQSSAYPPPPSLHWILVFVLNMITSGIFVIVWIFVQARWIKSIDRSSTAIRDYILGMLLGVCGVVACASIVLISVGTGGISEERVSAAGIGSLGLGLTVLSAFVIAGAIFHFRAIFGMRTSMLTHYNTVEPINLKLSAIMTFFFNVFYFQYHFTRIAIWKKTGVLQPQS